MLQVGYKTNKGMIRKHNEDACFIIPEKNIYMVADGVGGNAGGEIASRTAVYEISQYVYANEIPDDASASDVKKYLMNALTKANDAIISRSDEQQINDRMATTIVVCCIVGRQAYIAHVGDSRAYIIRKNQIVQITKDHTYVNALVEAGMLTPEEALTHEKRHMITRALGAEDSVRADYRQVEVAKGDRIVLCTDGLYGMVGDRDIATVAGDSSLTMSQVCDKLVDMANAAGGEDNITVVCLRV